MAVYSSTQGHVSDLSAFSAYPAGVPPPGQHANFANPPRECLGPFILGSILGVAMLCGIGCRIYAKVAVARRLWWDDYCCLIGALGTVTCIISLFILLTQGVAGIELYNMKVGRVIMDINFISTYVFIWGTAFAAVFIRLAFFFMYWQVFGLLRWMKVSLVVVGVLTTLVNTALNIVVIYFSTPRPGETWVGHAESGSQGAPEALGWPIGVINIVADVFILVVPMPAIASLNLPRRRKQALYLVFLAGIFAVASSCLSTYYRWLINGTSEVMLMVERVYFVVCVEYCVGITCSCAPAVSFAIRRLRGGGHTRYGSSNFKSADSATIWSIPHKRGKSAVFGDTWAQATMLTMNDPERKHSEGDMEKGMAPVAEEGKEGSESIKSKSSWREGSDFIKSSLKRSTESVKSKLMRNNSNGSNSNESNRNDSNSSESPNPSGSSPAASNSADEIRPATPIQASAKSTRFHLPLSPSNSSLPVRPPAASSITNTAAFPASLFGPPIDPLLPAPLFSTSTDVLSTSPRATTPIPFGRR